MARGPSGGSRGRWRMLVGMPLRLGLTGCVAAAGMLLTWGPGCAASRAPAAGIEGAEAVPVPEWEPKLGAGQAERFAAMARACVHREYPNKMAHVLAGPQDVGTPQSQTPAFYGCFDWHSAVHGHWLLARLARRFPDAELSGPARQALGSSLTTAAIEAEVRYVGREDRAGFERPYGLAWLLQLAAELRAWDDPEARAWAQALAPLEELAARRLAEWVPKLSHPIRSGEHSQTAFAFGLALDWAREREDAALAELLEAESQRLYQDDRDCALHLEPSGHDFLSPCLGAADLMRRVLPPPRFATWLSTALPQIPTDGRGDWLPLAVPADRTDGKLVHLDGLNLSRAWMLDGIEHGLPRDDARRASLRAAARRHAESGLAAVSDEHYEGGHWLASFAVYLTTRRGISGTTAETSPPAGTAGPTPARP